MCHAPEHKATQNLQPYQSLFLRKLLFRWSNSEYKQNASNILLFIETIFLIEHVLSCESVKRACWIWSEHVKN